MPASAKDLTLKPLRIHIYPKATTTIKPRHSTDAPLCNVWIYFPRRKGQYLFRAAAAILLARHFSSIQTPESG
uniref:Uncharacterized protein n=1 Tax=Physcomitrium patens TaxID=3218 RepID=A0A2K1KXE6_PHYPA|nr:hypothetical protein PHYPA_005452 [Physcomitrium patens]